MVEIQNGCCFKFVPVRFKLLKLFGRKRRHGTVWSQALAYKLRLLMNFNGFKFINSELVLLTAQKTF